MLRNYFKTAWRNLWKSKFYTGINVLGLSIGLTTAILLLLWIQDEQSFDKFIKDYDRVYNVSSHFNANGKEQTWTGVPGPVYKYANALTPVETATRINSDAGVSVHQPNSTELTTDLYVAYVDSSFFAVFNYPLLEGSASHPFPNNNSVLLTASTAKKIFGSTDVVGKVIVQDTTPFMVAGILADFPKNSSLRFHALFPMSYYAKLFTEGGGNGDWKTIDEDLGNYAFETYIKLKPGAGKASIGNALSQAYKDARNGDSDTKFVLQALADKHLISADGNKSALHMVQVFTIIAILLLGIASVNYINMSTARAAARAKEVSVRKIIGASKWQLFIQFITETIIIFTIATVLAMLFAWLLIPAYNTVAGKSLDLSFVNFSVWLVIGVAVLGALVLASIYPAIHLSSFEPINALKSKIGQSTGSAWLRKVLVVFQFSVSVILIIATLVISQQMQYISRINLGFNKEHVFTVPLSENAANHLDAVKAELKQSRAILGTAASSFYNIADYGNSTGDIDWPGKPKESNMVVSRATVDKDFIPVMNLTLIEGRNFDGTPSDTSSYVVNETMVKQMGLQPPYVGKPMSLHESPGVIIGVVKDFHFKSLKDKIGPMVLWTRRWKGTLYVKTTAAQAQQAIKAVEAIYKKYPGSNPFSYRFVDSRFDDLYKSDNRTKTLLITFAGIAIFISCLGLLALAAYAAQLRTKEIGVRKVLGASVTNIVGLLGKDFIVLVIIAIVIAVPVAWYGMNKWLDNFAYKISVSGWLFIAASAIAVGIALITISFQSIKAAIANPIKSLRTE